MHTELRGASSIRYKRSITKFFVLSGKSVSFPYSLCIQRILELKPVDISRIDRDGWVSVDTDGHYVTDFKQNLPPQTE